MGGLGNQMFQYAFGSYLARKNGTELKFDLTFLLDRTPSKNEHFVFRDFDLSIFELDVAEATKKEIAALTSRTGIPFAEKVLNKLAGTKKSYIREEHFHVSEQYLELPDNVYLEGYWQSPAYFDQLPADELSRLFTFKNPVSGAAASLMETIEADNSVCVNVRRGDFVHNPFHGSMDTSYFSSAEKLLNEKYPGLSYYVFSDDIEWCRENLQFTRPVRFISHEYAGEKFQDYLRLMSACKHFIIPNSSFAWWAVWLSSNPDKTVIAPANWFSDSAIDTSDLVPSNWIRR